jgi:hypothetical protein
MVSFITPEKLQEILSAEIEYGVNSNGEYIKFGNGVLICWRSGTTGSLGSTGNYGIGTYGWSIYYGATAVTFPHAFASAPGVVGSCDGGIMNPQSVTATGFNVTPYGITTSGKPYYYTAIGRWK